MGARSFLTENLSSIHGAAYPAEIRVGEPIKAFIKYNSIILEARVWRLSPMGIEIVKEAQLDPVKVGDALDLEVCIGVERSDHFAGVVAEVIQENGLTILGLRFHQQDEKEWGGEERRTAKRWGCSTEFLPNGVAPNPGKFNDFIFFKILDISATGVKIQTSLRNKFLVRGIHLNTTVTCPTVGSSTVKLRIENASIIEKSGKEFLSLGCSFQKPSKNFLNMISQYLFQFGSLASLKELRDAGLNIEQTSRGIEYKFVRTQEEYGQVLDLRKVAYGGAGKLASDNDVSDVFDARSRIIIGVYKGKIIASLRLIFSENDDQMEHEQFVSFGSKIPHKNQICEITRVCTHPDFRGSDLLVGLLKFAAVTASQSGRRFVLGCATDTLLPLYLKIGFRDMGIRFTHKGINSIEHTIFHCDLTDVAVGRGVGPIVWNLLWSDVVAYVSENQILNFDPASNIRIGIYKMFSPLAKIVSLFMQMRKSNRKKRK